MGSDVGLGTFLEGHRLRRFELRLSTPPSAGLDRVYPVQPLSPPFPSSLAGFGEREGVSRPEPHLPQSAALRIVRCRSGNAVAEHPAFCTARTDEQIQVAAVAVIAGLARPRDVQRFEFADLSRHVRLTLP